MTIVKTCYKDDFRQAFEEIRPDNFSYEGLEALYDYLEELSDDMGEALELDVIAICCEYTELNIYEIIETYDFILEKMGYNADEIELILVNISKGLKNEKLAGKFLDKLYDYTTVITVSDETYIIWDF